MNRGPEKSSGGGGPEMRSAFPEACKWFRPASPVPVTDQAASEVETRFRQLQEKGVSSCEHCPLCPGHG